MIGRDLHGNITARALAIAIRRLNANGHLLSRRCREESLSHLWCLALTHRLEHETARLVYE